LCSPPARIQAPEPECKRQLMAERRTKTRIVSSPDSSRTWLDKTSSDHDWHDSVSPLLIVTRNGSTRASGSVSRELWAVRLLLGSVFTRRRTSHCLQGPTPYIWPVPGVSHTLSSTCRCPHLWHQPRRRRRLLRALPPFRQGRCLQRTLMSW